MPVRRITKVMFTPTKTTLHWEDSTEDGEWEETTKVYPKQLPMTHFKKAMEALVPEACEINNFSKDGVSVHGLNLKYKKSTENYKAQMIVQRKAKHSSSPCNAHTPLIDLSNLKDTDSEFRFKKRLRALIESVHEFAIDFINGDRELSKQEKIKFSDKPGTDKK